MPFAWRGGRSSETDASPTQYRVVFVSFFIIITGIAYTNIGIKTENLNLVSQQNDDVTRGSWQRTPLERDLRDNKTREGRQGTGFHPVALIGIRSWSHFIFSLEMSQIYTVFTLSTASFVFSPSSVKFFLSARVHSGAVESVLSQEYIPKGRNPPSP